MKDYPYGIYAMNESLLDRVGTEEVRDDETDENKTSEYRFTFHLNTEHDMKVVKNMFFGIAMEPVLERMKCRGLVVSWRFDRKVGKHDDLPNIGIYSDRMYGMEANLRYRNAVILSVYVQVPVSEEKPDNLGAVAAYMMQSVIICGISNPGTVMMEFAKKPEGSDMLCVYDIFHDDGKWIFHCGIDGWNSGAGCSFLAGCFIRTAGALGIMEAVDDDRTRYVVYSFGRLNPDDEKMYFIDSDGNELESYEVDLDEVVIGNTHDGIRNEKFLDNGLMYVRFKKNKENYLRMDGTCLLEKDAILAQMTFDEGYAVVGRYSSSANSSFEYNMVDKDGNELLDGWCASLGPFVNGIAVIGKFIGDDSLVNIIDTSGNVLFDDWYDEVSFEPGTDCRRDVARVMRCSSDGYTTKYNYIDRNGKMLLDEWFTGSCKVMKSGFAELSMIKNNKCLYNYLRANGRLVSDEWFNYVCGWPECGVFVSQGTTPKDFNWVFRSSDTNEIIFDDVVFDRIRTHESEDGFRYYLVEFMKKDQSGATGRKFYDLISADGVLCCGLDSGMKRVDYIGNGFAEVSDTPTGDGMLWKWGAGPVEGVGEVLSAHDFENGYSFVKSTTQGCNFIDKDGKLVSDVWFNDCDTQVQDGFFKVKFGSDDGLDVFACKSRKPLCVKIPEGSAMKRIYAIVPDEIVVVEVIERGNILMYNIFDADGRQMLPEWTRFRPFVDKPSTVRNGPTSFPTSKKPIHIDSDNGIIKVGPASYVDYSGKVATLI